MDALVGAGGWGYFSGGLEAYARGCRFVEVNVSFYRRIPEDTARRWRSRVPDDFVFAIKANHAITHADRLRASARARAAFAHDLRIARILRSPFVILETPPGLRFEAAQIAGLRELAEMSEGGPRLGLEARSYRRGRLPEELRSAMEDDRVLDVVDLSQGPPRIADDVVYTRLFGPGPADREIAVPELSQPRRSALRNRNTCGSDLRTIAEPTHFRTQIASKSTWESCSSTYYNRVIIFSRTPPG